MRRRTRNAIVGLLVVLGLLVALGFLPGFLASGDPYYVTVTPIANDSGYLDTVEGTDVPAPAVNGSDLPPRRFPYTTDAVDRVTAESSGRSDPYWRGYVGLKEAFTHSPFDELGALRQRNPDASLPDDEIRLLVDGDYYRVGITQEGST